MQTYLALLRGINVGGQKKIKMSRLKEMMVKLGFVDVQTYIQSGNLVFKYQQTKSDGIADIIKSGIAGEFGHDVEVLVLDRKTFKNIIEKSPYSVADGLDKKLLYYVFLIDPPEQEAEGRGYPPTQVVEVLCRPAAPAAEPHDPVQPVSPLPTRRVPTGTRWRSGCRQRRSLGF